MKLDFSGLATTHAQFDAPATHAGNRKKILDDFMAMVADGEAQRSAYRCPQKLSLEFDKCRKLAETFRTKFKRLFVLGTGGSSLGAKALYTALIAHCDRELIFIENLDAADLPRSYEKSDFAASAVVAISKSGNTLETLLALSQLENEYTRHGLTIKDHFSIITDAGSHSALTKWAEAHAVEAIHMDPLLGGRWSVTSSVGALPLTFAGFNFKEFFSAVESVFSRAPDSATVDFAARLCELDDAKFLLHSQWIYSSRLREIGGWWRQLWSESLGKDSGGITKGAFALPCVGAVDQHSVLQQFAEGHAASYSGFIFVDENKPDLVAENFSPEIAAKFAYLNGRSWTEIIKAQGRATLQSLQEKGRPTYTISLPNISEKSLGEFMAFWMDVVALTGAGLKVNPFNQPGVERAKQIFSTLF